MLANFDRLIDRRGTHSSKWDAMEPLFGVSSDDGLAMWTADSDYPTAPCVIEAVRAAADPGIFGYFFDDSDYHNAICWWMEHRHGWKIDPDWILTSAGLGNAIGLCLDVYTDPGDSVVIFSPVYHEFANKIERAGRQVKEIPLVLADTRYEIDLDAAQAQLTGAEKMLIWCSPQNPSGRIWSADELRAVAEFARANDLILLSDEVHHDLIMPGHRFVPLDVAAPEARDRLVVLTAASKTFNIAGQRTGNMIIPDATLRDAMQKRMKALDLSSNRLGVEMVTAAYSPEGAAWVDAQVAHLNRNRETFDTMINAIPGVRSLPLESTYLAWVDFSGTGMSFAEVEERVKGRARIAASPGPAFGQGGETFLRFNLATQHARVDMAGARLQEAFSDLQ